MKPPLFFTETASPIGKLTLLATDHGLAELRMEKKTGDFSLDASWIRDDENEFLAATVTQLKEYFSGRRRDFELQLVPKGTTFQRRAWEILREIPYGETISYGEQARRAGSPGASRAVGLANNRNPLAIIIPCHRVVGANGALTGFGGGLPRKRFLLDFEQRHDPFLLR